MHGLVIHVGTIQSDSAVGQEVGRAAVDGSLTRPGEPDNLIATVLGGESSSIPSLHSPAPIAEMER